MNVVPHTSKVNPTQSQFDTVGDMFLIEKLLKTPRYNIPPHLRDKIIRSAADMLDANDKDGMPHLQARVSACKILLEADKRNIDLVKIAMPKKVEHKHVKEMTNEELEIIIQQGVEILTNKRLSNEQTQHV